MKTKEQKIQSGITIIAYCLLAILCVCFIAVSIIAGYNSNTQIIIQDSYELEPEEITEASVQNYTIEERMLNEIFNLTYGTGYRCVKIADINNTYYFDYTVQDLAEKYATRNTNIENNMLDVNSKIQDILVAYNCDSDVIISVLDPSDSELVYFMIEHDEIAFTIYNIQRVEAVEDESDYWKY